MFFHRSAPGDMFLNKADAAGSSFTKVTDSSETDFTVSAAAEVNANGGSYIAYLFPNDTSDEGVVRCGNVVSQPGGLLNLGWEPQFVIWRRAEEAFDWAMLDQTRGWGSPSGTVNKPLFLNKADAEATGYLLLPHANGITVPAESPGKMYVFMAIRKAAA